MATTVNARDVMLQGGIEQRSIRVPKTVNSATAPWTNSFPNPSSPAVYNITATVSGSVKNPDGTSATKYIPTVTNATHEITTQIVNTTYSSPVNVQIAAYIKADSTAHRVRLRVVASNVAQTYQRQLYYAINALTGATTDSSADAGWSAYKLTVINVGNGWWKCVVTGTYTNSSNESQIFAGFQIINPSNSISYAGNGSDGPYVFAPQSYVGSQPDEVLNDIWINPSVGSSGAYWNGYTWLYIGQGGISGSLTKEAYGVAAGNDGSVASYTNSGGTFKVYSGITDITTGNGVSYSGTATQNGLTLTINASTGVYTLSAANSTAWTTDSETFTLTATYSGASIVKLYTITKFKTGATGATGATGSTGATGATGATGQSNHRVYIAATSGSPPSTPGTTTSGAVPVGWSAVPVSLTTGQVQYQSDGTTPSGSTTTTWQTPYPSYLKVGSLEAITVNTGALTVTDVLTVGTSGKIQSSGGGYNSGSAGFFLGYDSGAYKFSVGPGTNNLTFDGTTLSIPAVRITGTVQPAQINPSSTWLNDNVRGGGINLVGNSGFMKTTNGTNAFPDDWIVYNGSNVTYTVNVASGGMFGQNYIRVTPTQNTSGTFGIAVNPNSASSVQTWVPGQTYCISFWARAAASMYGAVMSALFSDMAWTTSEILEQPALSANWQRYVFRVNPASNSYTSQGTLYIGWSSAGGVTQVLNGANLDICAPKVELGSQPTGWSPAPLDIYNRNIAISGGAITGIGTGSGTVVDNSQITISGGALQGIGTGTGTVVANSAIAISGGAITGIGTGNNTVVANSSIAISGGAITGIGTGNNTVVANSAIAISGGAITGIGAGAGTYVDNTQIAISAGAIVGIGTGNNTVVANSSIVISGGALNGIGTGAGTVVANTSITISSGAIQGIGTGAGTYVDNTRITLSSDGTLVNAGGGQATLSGMGLTGLTLVNYANCTITGDTIKKTSGGDAWNGGAHSAEKYTACIATISVHSGLLTTSAMFGLNENETTGSYTDINHAIYLAGGTTYIYEEGVEKGSYGSYTTGDVFSVLYNGLNIQYIKNGTIFYERALTSTSLFFFDCSIYNVNAYLAGVRFSAISNLRNQLVDSRYWVSGSTGSQPTFTELATSTGGLNYIDYDTLPDGTKGLLWRARSGSANGTSSEGGWTGTDFTIDPTKMYRFTVWTRRYGANTSGQIYIGLNGDGVRAVPSSGSGNVWNFDSTTESFTATNATIAASGGILTLTPTTGDAQLIRSSMSFAGVDNTLIKMKIRRVSGSGWQGDLYWTTTVDVAYSESLKAHIADTTVTGAWRILTWSMSDANYYNKTITALRFDLGTTVSDVFEIDWIALGNNNPYFISGLNRSSLNSGEWYLNVGYVYPFNYTGTQDNKSGTYRGADGVKLSNGTDFQWLPEQRTSLLRAYQFVTTASSNYVDFWAPKVEIIDGTERPLDQMLATGAISGRNPITTTNVATIIPSAAIGWAQIGNLDISTSGAIKSGKTAYTDDANSGWWMGIDSGTPKFKFGGSSGNRLVWDGTNLKVEYNTSNLVKTGIADRLDVGESDTQVSSATASATLYFYADGTTSAGINWYNPTTSNIGSSYYIRITRTTGNNPTSGDTLATWLALSSTRSVGLSATGVLKSSGGTIEISTTNNGSNIVLTGSYSLVAESYTSGSIP